MPELEMRLSTEKAASDPGSKGRRNAPFDPKPQGAAIFARLKMSEQPFHFIQPAQSAHPIQPVQPDRPPSISWPGESMEVLDVLHLSMRNLARRYSSLVALVAAGCVTTHTCPDPECAPPCKEKAAVCTNPTMHALASDLDHLERMIDRYGSVVAKVPDVWGQARLTRYREEFEKLMEPEAAKFEETLQGAIVRSDQAFLANASAISAAISGRQAGLFAPRPRVQINTATNLEKPAGTITVPDANIETGAFAGFTSIKRNDPILPGPIGFDKYAKGGIQLERTRFLDEKARYLNHLSQLRRNNEGDDTSDSPGYSLNLARIPVSVLPGKLTDNGYGAEATFTLTPVLGDELLPTTFRSLVIKDLVDLLAPAIVTSVAADRQTINAIVKKDYNLAQIPIKKQLEHNEVVSAKVATNIEIETRRLANLESELASAKAEAVEKFKREPNLNSAPDRYSLLFDDSVIIDGNGFNRIVNPVLSKELNIPSPPQSDDDRKKLQDANSAAWLAREAIVNTKLVPIRHELNEAKAVKKAFEKESDRLKAQKSELMAQLSTANAPATATDLTLAGSFASRSFTVSGRSRSRNSTMPVPPSQLVSAIGTQGLGEIIVAMVGQTRSHLDRGDGHYLLDVERALQDEVTAGYRALSPGGREDLWHHFIQHHRVAHLVRTHQVDQLECVRKEFYDRFPQEVNRAGRIPCKVALAWAVLVESALLSEKLAEDIKEAASNHNCGCLANAAGLPFYLPDPPAEARQTFNEYVRCRFPIHVFALDPVTEDQNVGDTFSMRREMQLALSLAFASGQINARTLTRYARRIEADIQTIALNRTQVGFSHGTDTFGWRFYPRLQTPDVESNATAIVRDNILGGPSKEALLRKHRLEPGVRECVALVIMPSFVPSLEVHSSGNWFSLTNPKHKEFTLTDTMRMSRLLKSVQSCNSRIADADCYRDGDLARLMAKARQLENRLSLQDLRVLVPNENNLGGFELFANGVTDLAPELRGWYGAPYIGVGEKASTTMFLVGKNFSVTQSRVIVGGMEIPSDRQRMISREVIQVTVLGVPKTRAVSESDGSTNNVIDVHVATPYGVSASLQVPAAAEGIPAEERKPGATWTAPTFELAFVYSGLGIAGSSEPTNRPRLALAWDEKADGPFPVAGSTARLAVKLDRKGVTPLDPVMIPITPEQEKKKELVVDGDLLAKAIMKAVQREFGPEQTNPPVSLKTSEVTLEITQPTGVKTIRVPTPLTINWVKAPK